MNDSLKAQCIAEFLGTGLFLFFGIGCLSALKVAGASLGLWEICIIWGLGISLAVYLTAGISGAHLNPAITVALWLFACFPGRKVLPYTIAQVAGAFGGALLAYLLYGSLFIEYETAHNRCAAASTASIWPAYSVPIRRLRSTSGRPQASRW
jgi:Glycerol uptake facilitator and related permeases (Major Intrinsic Protein Family)